MCYPPEVEQLAPEKLPGPNRKGSSSNHHFSGAVFNFRGVYMCFMFFFTPIWEKMNHFDEYVSIGLKSPPLKSLDESCVLVELRAFEKPQESTSNVYSSCLRPLLSCSKGFFGIFLVSVGLRLPSCLQRESMYFYQLLPSDLLITQMEVT